MKHPAKLETPEELQARLNALQLEMADNFEAVFLAFEDVLPPPSGAPLEVADAGGFPSKIALRGVVPFTLEVPSK